MIDHQIHFDRKFYLDKDFGYWISTDYPRIRAHRWVWIKNNGDIPIGYEIHHIDENKSNNNLFNLQLISISHHRSLHITEEKKSRLKIWAAHIRPLTKEWHASEEGKSWHKIHAKNHSFGKWSPTKYTCQQCNAQYESTKKSRALFCSNNCKSAFRRDQGLDDIEKSCERCCKKFKSNKYARTRFCGKSCSKKKTESWKIKATQLFLTL